MRTTKCKIIIFFIIVGSISLLYYKKTGGSICVFYNFFGIPCFTCGMTRSFFSLLNLDFKKAFFYHPLFFLVPIIPFTLKKIKYFYFISAIFALVWIIRLVLLFPNQEPFKFNENAVYPKVYKFIKDKF